MGIPKKVAVTDYTFSDLAIEETILRDVDAELHRGQNKTVEALIPQVRDADVVITQFAPINDQVIAAMERARAIIRYGIGVDNVNLQAAAERKIPVCNVPDYCIDEVADHTLAFILAMTRQVVPNCLHVRAGQWGLATPLEQMRCLADQTVGIIGFGRIGREVAARLAPLKCRRLVFDPAIPPSMIEWEGCEVMPLHDLLPHCDLLTLHCPSTPQTRKLINENSLAQMKRGSMLVNLARGDLVDTDALVAALQSGHLSGAALDVCDKEPIPQGHPLRSMEQVVLASHIASASPKAVRKLRETAARLAAMALRGEVLPNVVNGL